MLGSEASDHELHKNTPITKPHYFYHLTSTTSTPSTHHTTQYTTLITAMSSKHRKRESGRAPRIPPLDPEEVQILSRVEYDKGRLDAFLRTLQKYPMDGPAWSNAVQCTYQLLRRMHVAGGKTGLKFVPRKLR